MPVRRGIPRRAEPLSADPTAPTTVQRGEHVTVRASWPACPADNAWTAPSDAGDVDLWAVLRDSRGGVTWGGYRVRVQ